MKIKIRAIPRSSKNEMIKMADGTIRVKLKAPPVEGEANEALIEFLSDEWGISKNKIKIINGLRSKNKLIEI